MNYGDSDFGGAVYGTGVEGGEVSDGIAADSYGSPRVYQPGYEPFLFR